MKTPKNLKLFQAETNTADEAYRLLLNSAWEEDRELTVRNIFFAGDRRHGLGSSAFMNNGLAFLASACPEWMNSLAQMVPEYGDWDNLLVLLHQPDVEKEAVHLFLGRINADINLIEERRPASSFSLCMPAGDTADGAHLAALFHLSIDNYDALIRSLCEKAEPLHVQSDFDYDRTVMNEEEMKKVLARYNRAAELIQMR